jgi:hypothetical protein
MGCYSAENLPLLLLLLLLSPDPLPAGNICWFVVPNIGVSRGSLYDKIRVSNSGETRVSCCKRFETN